MEEFWEEHARQTAQQTQSLWKTLQKGIASVITTQLTPIYTELMVLETHATKVDMLAV